MSSPLDEHPTRADQDQAEATQLYRLATEQGIAGAQYRLGVMYAKGQGMAQDDRESVRWFRLAAEQGNTEAQAGLGLAYGASARGVSVEALISSNVHQCRPRLATTGGRGYLDGNARPGNPTHETRAGEITP